MDVDPDLIRKRVRDSAGAKYSHQQKDLRLRKDIHDSGPDHASVVHLSQKQFVMMEGNEI